MCHEKDIKNLIDKVNINDIILIYGMAYIVLQSKSIG
jgi:hypothetical protein